MSVRFLTVQEVIAINVAMMKKYSLSGQVGVQSQSLLQSAVYHPMQTSLGEEVYPSIFEKAAVLLESLGQNYAFRNANKRTAFTAMALFLRYNGYFLRMEQKQAESLTAAMVEHKYCVKQLAGIIEQNSHKPSQTPF